FFVAYSMPNFSFGNAVLGEVVTAGGAVSSAGRLCPGNPSPVPGEYSPTIVSDGSGYFAAWGDNRGGLYGAHIDAAGNVQEPAGLVPASARAPSPPAPSLASAPAWGLNLPAWTDNPIGTTFNIYGMPLAPGGASLDGPGTQLSPTPGTAPAVG